MQRLGVASEALDVVQFETDGGDAGDCGKYGQYQYDGGAVVLLLGLGADSAHVGAYHHRECENDVQADGYVPGQQYASGETRLGRTHEEYGHIDQHRDAEARPDFDLLISGAQE